jgi:hypothetical protein
VHRLRRRPREPGAEADVAEPGLGFGRADADGDDGLARLGERGAHELREGGLVADEGIGGEHGDDRGGPGPALGDHRAEADRGRRVAGHRLGDDVLGRQVGEGGAHRRLLIGRGHHQRPFEADERACAGLPPEQRLAPPSESFAAPRAPARRPEAGCRLRRPE